MERKRFQDAICPIARSLDVVGDWWTPLILRECLYGNHRFDALQRWLGIGRNILTKRLRLLVDSGVLEKRPYQERPRRYEYHLTDKGHAAARVTLAMMEFGDDWLFAEQASPIWLYDRRTGQRVVPTMVDKATGEPIDTRHLYAGPGPGFPDSDAARQMRFVEYTERQEGAR